MRLQILHKAVLVALVALVATMVAGPRAQKEKETQTITGVVTAFEKNREKVLSVYIVDAEHGKFLVVRGTEMGKELIDNVGATVKATGYVKKVTRTTEFALALDVLEYEIVSEAPLVTSNNKARGKPGKRPAR